MPSNSAHEGSWSDLTNQENHAFNAPAAWRARSSSGNVPRMPVMAAWSVMRALCTALGATRHDDHDPACTSPQQCGGPRARAVAAARNHVVDKYDASPFDVFRPSRKAASRPQTTLGPGAGRLRRTIHATFHRMSRDGDMETPREGRSQKGGLVVAPACAVVSRRAARERADHREYPLLAAPLPWAPRSRRPNDTRRETSEQAQVDRALVGVGIGREHAAQYVSPTWAREHPEHRVRRRDRGTAGMTRSIGVGPRFARSVGSGDATEGATPSTPRRIGDRRHPRCSQRKVGSAVGTTCR